MNSAGDVAFDGVVNAQPFSFPESSARRKTGSYQRENRNIDSPVIKSPVQMQTRSEEFWPFNETNFYIGYAPGGNVPILVPRNYGIDRDLTNNLWDQRPDMKLRYVIIRPVEGFGNLDTMGNLIPYFDFFAYVFHGPEENIFFYPIWGMIGFGRSNDPNLQPPYSPKQVHDAFLTIKNDAYLFGKSVSWVHVIEFGTNGIPYTHFIWKQWYTADQDWKNAGHVREPLVRVTDLSMRRSAGL